MFLVNRTYEGLTGHNPKKKHAPPPLQTGSLPLAEAKRGMDIVSWIVAESRDFDGVVFSHKSMLERH